MGFFNGKLNEESIDQLAEHHGNILDQQHSAVQWEIFTGKSFSEALVLASTNPQYDKRLFI